MIISAMRRPLSRGRVSLESWLRAPLALNEGTRCYITVEPGVEPANGEFVELFCSPFDPVHWRDTWRIEIETEDNFGNLHHLLKILAEKNIKVLASEGSVNTDGTLHAMSYIISCIDYRSTLDLNYERRIKTDDFQLIGLFDEIAIEMIEELNFGADGEPKLKIRRLDTYFSVAKRSDQKEIPAPQRVKIKEGGFEIPASILGHARSNISSSLAKDSRGLMYSAAVDTKDRIVKLLVFGRSSRQICHMQFVMRNNPKLLAAVVELLAGDIDKNGNRIPTDTAVNIIKYQIRQGENLSIGELDSQIKDDCVRIDVTFLPLIKRHDMQSFCNIIQDRVAKQADLHRLGVRITKFDSYFCDGDEPDAEPAAHSTDGNLR